MGASISFDSKYRLILDTEVECISVNTPDAAAEHKKKHGRNKDDHRESGSESESGESGGESGESGSDSDSDSENKTYTVKITPEIVNYIRSYLRKTQFLDEFDLITEIDLDAYNHAPGATLVFNSDSIVFMTNNQTIEAVGDWEYIQPERTEPSKSKSKSKDKSKSRRDIDSDDSDDTVHQHDKSKYKTKDDDLPVGEIENIMKEKFEDYNKTREFIIHESKNSFLCMKINSVEIVKA